MGILRASKSSSYHHNCFYCMGRSSPLYEVCIAYLREFHTSFKRHSFLGGFSFRLINSASLTDPLQSSCMFTCCNTLLIILSLQQKPFFLTLKSYTPFNKERSCHSSSQTVSFSLCRAFLPSFSDILILTCIPLVNSERIRFVFTYSERNYQKEVKNMKRSFEKLKKITFLEKEKNNGGHLSRNKSHKSEQNLHLGQQELIFGLKIFIPND